MPLKSLSSLGPTTANVREVSENSGNFLMHDGARSLAQAMDVDEDAAGTMPEASTTSASASATTTAPSYTAATANTKTSDRPDVVEEDDEPDVADEPTPKLLYHVLG